MMSSCGGRDVTQADVEALKRALAELEGVRVDLAQQLQEETTKSQAGTNPPAPSARHAALSRFPCSLPPSLPFPPLPLLPCLMHGVRIEPTDQPHSDQPHHNTPQALEATCSQLTEELEAERAALANEKRSHNVVLQDLVVRGCSPLGSRRFAPEQRPNGAAVDRSAARRQHINGALCALCFDGRRVGRWVAGQREAAAGACAGAPAVDPQSAAGDR